MRIFAPTKKTRFHKQVYGFDIETEGDDNNFVMGSLVGDCFEKEFYDKQSLVNEIVKKKYKDSLFVATNLGFDFFGVFFGHKVLSNFRLIQKGSRILSAFCYVYKGEFYPRRPNKSAWKIEFIDTLNYALLSVEKLGKTIGIPKLKKPSVFLPSEKTILKEGIIYNKIGDVRLPGTLEEWEELIIYNLRDSEISKKFMDYFIESVNELGGNFKLTIASSAMSLYKTKYFNMRPMVPHAEDTLRELFKAYYGGRVEVFERGLIKSTKFRKFKLYDINSLYPSVMRDFEFPNPSTLHIVQRDTIKYIERCEGVSHVDVSCPEDIKVPFLPFRFNGKLIFPTGTFSGYYSHVELRFAMTLGYVIKKVYKSYYYTYNCEPFKEFVTDLYTKRQQYIKEKNPMEYVTKIFMNSLYGKFGERFDKRLDLQPFNFTYEQLKNIDMIERKGDFIYYNEEQEPKAHCIPIWALYVTAYARIRLYSYLKQYDPIYCDTDSIITRHPIPESKELGLMKLEYSIDEALIIKPKFYALKLEGGKQKTKAKGIPFLMTYAMIMQKPISVDFNKFVKFKEGIRREILINKKIGATKILTFEDDKRTYDGEISFKHSQAGFPLVLENGELKDNNLYKLPKIVNTL